jgi:orotate phosphoribosyltransferase
MNYKTVEEMNADAHRLAKDLPQDIDLVVGIPRSGLLAANLLCLHLDVPMTDVENLCAGRMLDTGSRCADDISFEAIDSVFVVDDSVLTGGQMTETRERLSEFDFPFDIQFGAVYISPRGHEYVDYWSEVVPSPRVFEWNILHHTQLENFCVDIDGVLCRDPTAAENDDGENYREFLTEVEPNIVPDQQIGWLVTSRLEKYRPETEAWLATHGIDYENLVMMDVPDMETRRERGNHAQHKAEAYSSTGASLFIESNRKQAAEICQETNKPVFCYGTNEMLQPGLAGRSYRKSVAAASGIQANPAMFVARTGHQLLSRCYHRLSR